AALAEVGADLLGALQRLDDRLVVVVAVDLQRHRHAARADQVDSCFAHGYPLSLFPDLTLRTSAPLRLCVKVKPSLRTRPSPLATPNLTTAAGIAAPRPDGAPGCPLRRLGRQWCDPASA